MFLFISKVYLRFVNCFTLHFLEGIATFIVVASYFFSWGRRFYLEFLLITFIKNRSLITPPSVNFIFAYLTSSICSLRRHFCIFYLEHLFITTSSLHIFYLEYLLITTSFLHILPRVSAHYILELSL